MFFPVFSLLSFLVSFLFFSLLYALSLFLCLVLLFFSLLFSFLFFSFLFSALFGLILGPWLDLLLALFGFASGPCLDLLWALLRRVALSSSLLRCLFVRRVLLVVRRVLCVDSFTATADHASSLCGNRHHINHQPPQSCMIHPPIHIISHRHHPSSVVED